MVDRLPTASNPRLPQSLNLDRSSLIAGPIYSPRLPQTNLPVDSFSRLPHDPVNSMTTGMFTPPGFPQQIAGPATHSLFVPFPNLNPPVIAFI